MEDTFINLTLARNKLENEVDYFQTESSLIFRCPLKKGHDSDKTPNFIVDKKSEKGKCVLCGTERELKHVIAYFGAK
mgnify:FL=1